MKWLAHSSPSFYALTSLVHFRGNTRLRARHVSRFKIFCDIHPYRAFCFGFSSAVCSYSWLQVCCSLFLSLLFAVASSSLCWTRRFKIQFTRAHGISAQDPVNHHSGHETRKTTLKHTTSASLSKHKMASTLENEDGVEYDSCSTIKGTYSPAEPMEELVIDTPDEEGIHRQFSIFTPQHLFPKSSYLGWEPPLPPSLEVDVLSELLVSEFWSAFPSTDLQQGIERRSRDTSSGNSFTSFDLDSFSIYQPSQRNGLGANRNAGELVALSDLGVKPANHCYYLDGLLSDGHVKHYIQNVPFKTLSIGGYEDTSVSTVDSDVWIQSMEGAKANYCGVWYRLKSPSPEYARFHEPFLWLADFAKHVIDFLKEHKNVSLQNFRGEYFEWLRDLHGDHQAFQQWAEAYGDVDFRRAIVAHSAFLQNQALQLNDSYRSHPLWGEVGPSKQDLCAVPPQLICQDKTLVTPLVYQCFKNLAFAKFLLPKEPKELREPIFHHDKVIPAPPDLRSQRTSRNSRPPERPTANIEAGDVVKLSRDASSDSKWRDDEKFWYAYVQRLEETRSGVGLRVIWLYSPSHTSCSTMHYPIHNELFLSNHCNCNERRSIPVEEVVAKTSVSFFGGSCNSDAEFFVRQRFLPNTAAFVELRKEHFTCGCEEATKPIIYEAGNTVLFKGSNPSGDSILEPVELLSAVHAGATSVKARKLLRRGRDFDTDDAEPNELVYSSVFEEVPVASIDRACHVRFYTMAERDGHKIPAPYCRQGTGDAFYVIFEEIAADHSLRELNSPYPPSLKQGFDPLEKPPLPRLRGLDLFCGGGNFGRGLEEGGAIELKWAVDIDTHAIHSYRANLADPSSVGLYLGSVNDLLTMGMDGQYSKLIPRPGEVDIIIGGSPCPGFSNANNRKGDDKALKNNSLIAFFAACVDFYRPKYALLENVPNIAECSPKNRDKNVFSQMICAFVAMGYQVQQFLLDAWTCGSPQSRTRLFISIAAPGCAPLPPPQMSHSHPLRVPSRGLGKAANGLKFGERILDAITPFQYRTFGEATADLPVNSDARVASVRFPDHQSPRVESTESRLRIACIPRFPRYSTIVTARAAELLPKPIIDRHPAFWKSKMKIRKGSKAWQRNCVDTLIPTVTTRVNPGDSFTGRLLHPVADRCLTVLEIRRAQGYPDQDVIVGSLANQWKIVGNSVPRTISLVLGMAVRQAWLANGPPTAGEQVLVDATTAVKRPAGRETTSGKSVLRHGSRPGKRKLEMQVKDPDVSDEDLLAKPGCMDEQECAEKDTASTSQQSKRRKLKETALPVLQNEAAASPTSSDPKKTIPTAPRQPAIPDVVNLVSDSSDDDVVIPSVRPRRVRTVQTQ